MTQNSRHLLHYKLLHAVDRCLLSKKIRKKENKNNNMRNRKKEKKAVHYATNFCLPSQALDTCALGLKSVLEIKSRPKVFIFECD